MELLSEAFEKYKKGMSVEDILAWLRENGVRISRTTFYEKLRQALDKDKGFSFVEDNEGTETDMLEITRRVNRSSYGLIKELINTRIKEKLREGDYAHAQHLIDLLFGAIHSFCVSARVLLQVENLSSSEFLKGLKTIAGEIGEEFLDFELSVEEDESVIERVRELFLLVSNEIARYTETVTVNLERASSTQIRLLGKLLKSLNELQREASNILKEANKFDQTISIERLLKGR